VSAAAGRLKGAPFAMQMAIRIAFVAQLLVGVLLWTGNFDQLKPFHIALGVVIILGLLVFIVVGVRARVQAGLLAAATILCVVVPLLGLTQEGLLASGPHWIIQVVHLVLGFAVIGSAEAIAGRLVASPRLATSKP
jgi:hypothetical protein